MVRLRSEHSLDSGNRVIDEKSAGLLQPKDVVLRDEPEEWIVKALDYSALSLSGFPESLVSCSPFVEFPFDVS